MTVQISPTAAALALDPWRFAANDNRRRPRVVLRGIQTADTDDSEFGTSVTEIGRHDTHCDASRITLALHLIEVSSFLGSNLLGEAG